MLSSPATETQITHGRRLWLYVLCALVMIFLILPSVIVIPMSFSDSRYLTFPPENWSLRWYQNYWGSEEWMAATKISLIAAILTTLIATPIGTAAAYGLHNSRMRVGGLINSYLLTPIMVPVILIAIGTFFLYSKLGLNNTLLGLVIAHSMMAIPFVLITVSAGFKSFDMGQEMVGRSLGASRTWAFLSVTLPQIKFSVISGALFAFIVSLDEVIIAMFVSGGDKSTLTRKMFSALRDMVDPTIAAISTILILLSVILLILIQILAHANEK